MRISRAFPSFVDVTRFKQHNWRFMFMCGQNRFYRMECGRVKFWQLRPLKKERRDVLEFLINRDDAKAIRSKKRFGKFGGC